MTLTNALLIAYAPGHYSATERKVAKNTLERLLGSETPTTDFRLEVEPTLKYFLSQLLNHTGE